MNAMPLWLKSRLPAAMLALYLFSFWMLPQNWNEDNAVDGSWRYALGKFRELDFSLGKDSWFTYGPLAHWVGAPMGADQHQPFPYYLLGLFVAAVIGTCFARLCDALGLSPRISMIAALVFPFSFMGMEGVQEIHVIVALFLLLISSFLQEKSGGDCAGAAAMVALSACGLLYKISLGMLSLFMLFVLLGSLYARRRIGVATILLHLAGYVTILYALFAITTGSYNLVAYLRLGLETSAKYSEIMIVNLPYSPPNYLIALAYIAAGGVLAWQASKRMAAPGAGLCLMTAYFGAMLFLFKHGFVRADLAHMKLFYACVTALLAILALVSFSGFRTKSGSSKAALCSASLIVVAIYGMMLSFLPGEAGPAKLAKNWLGSGNRMIAGFKGAEPGSFAEKKAFVGNSQPRLFSWLNGHAGEFGDKGRRPRITFYPWELLNFEGVVGYRLAPSPSLQLYSTGPHSLAHRLEEQFLSSADRPDVVVIGPAALDDRSPVSELTDLWPPLFAHYRVVAVVDGFSILAADASRKASASAPAAAIAYSDKPTGAAGEFVSISFDQPGAVNGLLWRLASTFFKAPELSVLVSVAHGNGEKVQYAWRGYLSQLRGGVLFSPQTVPEFIGSRFRRSGQASLPPAPSASPIESAAAELRRSGGFWNLPVVPRTVPLKVQYASFN